MFLSPGSKAIRRARVGKALFGTIPSIGYCQFAKSGSNLVLSPYGGGNQLAGRLIRESGVSLGPSGLSNSTLYYIYAVLTSDPYIRALEASTTGYTSVGGLKVKTGNPSRVLVGMAYLSGGAFVSSATQRFVRTWFNDPGIGTVSNYTANRSTASTTYVEVNTEIRNEFLLWSGEVVVAAVAGATFNSAGSNVARTTVGFDGTTGEPGAIGSSSPSANIVTAVGGSYVKTGLSEGYHYCTLLGKTDTGTQNWGGSGTADSATALSCYIHK